MPLSTKIVPLAFWALVVLQGVFAEGDEANPLLQQYNVSAIKAGRDSVPDEEILQLLEPLLSPVEASPIYSAPTPEAAQASLKLDLNILDLLGKLRGAAPTRKKYKMIKEYKNFFNAVMRCAQDNMKLATINNVNDQLDIVELILEEHGNKLWSLWVGGTNVYDVSEWQWMGEKCAKSLNTFSKWLPGNPRHGQFCMQTTTFGWQSMDCNLVAFVICES